MASYQQLMSVLGMPVPQGLTNKRSIVELSSDTAKNALLREKAVMRGIVPDVSGMGLRDAVYLLETSGLQVQ
jgi:cell division protein FtsI (penicillin-binding protein 3)